MKILLVWLAVSFKNRLHGWQFPELPIIIMTLMKRIRFAWRVVLSEKRFKFLEKLERKYAWQELPIKDIEF